MTKRRRAKKKPKSVESLTHDEASRKNIPTAEFQSLAQRVEKATPVKPVVYERQSPLAQGETRLRDEDLDPQIVWKGATLSLNEEQIEQLTKTGKLEIGDAELVWRGKDQQDWSNLVVQAPPLYIQEKIHPKAIIEGLKKQTKQRQDAGSDISAMSDLFEDFNGIDPEAKTEFYQHDQNWQNRMILGDSLQVMASLAERESLSGKVQSIYFDPPYGIKFNSNWQVSTRSRDVKDGKPDQITREPEQVKAFRDTWKDGIHSYLTYLRDRMTAMRDLLTESGSIFVQIGDENVHRVRALMDEVFGEKNFVSTILVQTAPHVTSANLPSVHNYVLWYAKNISVVKFRSLFKDKDQISSINLYRNLLAEDGQTISKVKKDKLKEISFDSRRYRLVSLVSQGASSEPLSFKFQGSEYDAGRNNHWKVRSENLSRVAKSSRIQKTKNSIQFRSFISDFPISTRHNIWTDTITGSFTDEKVYIVQTNTKVVERCLLMATDPGDLVLDPTCGSGTTATVAEQWGRRWITIDTSRVALALARARLMGARYPYYYLADSAQGRGKEQEISGIIQPDSPTYGDIRQGFVYKCTPHIMLKTIANNADIDVIWEKYQQKLEPLRKELNEFLGETWEEWEIPRKAGSDWLQEAKDTLRQWWELRIERQQAIDTSIAQKADEEYLYDRPYEDKSKVRVAGPFTVESLSPHRMISAEAEELIHDNDFTAMVLENLKSAGVHQAAKDARIHFMSIDGWPGSYIAAEGRYMAKEGQSEIEKRAAIFIGPEFGTVTLTHLTAAAREAMEARFDTLIACGFNFEAHTSELSKLGSLPILKARMNPDLHMSAELKNTGSGNLFIVFGEPDVKWSFDDDGNIIVEVLGIDVFDPKTGEVRASGKSDIAAWFIDTDYNRESFFVRQAYFFGAQDPYKALKTSLKAEIDHEAWETLYCDKSRPFSRPETGLFAVKVINHFGDEVMKVFRVLE